MARADNRLPKAARECEKFMNTQFFRVSVLVAAVGSLVLCSGCAEEGKAQTAVPVFTGPPPVDSAQPPGPRAELESAQAGPPQPAVKVVQAPAPPAEINPSPALAEVIKLVNAGVGDEVLLGFIGKSTQPFSITSDQIVYLNDLGVSTGVITSLIKHDSGAEMGLAQSAVAGSLPPAGQNVQTPGPVSSDPRIYATTPAVTVEQPVVAPEFDASLSPYGSWIEVEGYGRCWQPTVAIAAPAWRPYCDRGHWLWSDCGWYWYSDYSWGWAPFHYGRWCSYPQVGWFWVPDTCWGPSWVSWRQNAGYCGWAPLPPSASFVAGIGFSHHGIHVGFGFDFGLTASLYTFVPLGHLHDRSFQNHRVSGSQATVIYNNSTVINNYVVNNKGTVINHGVGVDKVAHAAGHAIPTVAVQTAQTAIPGAGGTRIRHEQLVNHGSGLAVVRPQLNVQTKPMAHSSAATQPVLRQDPLVGNSSAPLTRTPSIPPVGQHGMTPQPQRNRPLNMAAQPTPALHSSTVTPSGQDQAAGKLPPVTRTPPLPSSQHAMLSPPARPPRTLNVTPQPAPKAETYRIYADPPSASRAQNFAASPARPGPAYTSPAVPMHPRPQLTPMPSAGAPNYHYYAAPAQVPMASHAAASAPAYSHSAPSHAAPPSAPRSSGNRNN